MHTNSLCLGSAVAVSDQTAAGSSTVVVLLCIYSNTHHPLSKPYLLALIFFKIINMIN
jgi:hypothetical protein